MYSKLTIVGLIGGMALSDLTGNPDIISIVNFAVCGVAAGLAFTWLLSKNGDCKR